MASKSHLRGKVSPGRALDAIDQAALDAAQTAALGAARVVVDNFRYAPKVHARRHVYCMPCAITQLSNALITLDRRQHNTPTRDDA